MNKNTYLRLIHNDNTGIIMENDDVRRLRIKNNISYRKIPINPKTNIFLDQVP